MEGTNGFNFVKEDMKSTGIQIIQQAKDLTNLLFGQDEFQREVAYAYPENNLIHKRMNLFFKQMMIEMKGRQKTIWYDHIMCHDLYIHEQNPWVTPEHKMTNTYEQDNKAKRIDREEIEEVNRLLKTNEDKDYVISRANTYRRLRNNKTY